MEHPQQQTPHRTYQDAGYWIGPRIFDDRAIGSLRAACTRVLSGTLGEPSSSHFLNEDNRPAGGLRRAFNASFVCSIIRNAVHNARIGELAGHLMGVDSVRLWYSQIIEKPGQLTAQATQLANVGWHQDYNYWRCCEHSNMLTAWIALQDTTHVNGAMRVVVGSHNWGLLAATRGFTFYNIDKRRDELLAETRHTWREETCDLAAGQVSFHHSLVLHASGPNSSPDPRIGIAIHLMPGNFNRLAHSACHQSLTFLEPMPSPGKPFVGPQWPIIWSSSLAAS